MDTSSTITFSVPWYAVTSMFTKTSHVNIQAYFHDTLARRSPTYINRNSKIQNITYISCPHHGFITASSFFAVRLRITSPSSIPCGQRPCPSAMVGTPFPSHTSCRRPPPIMEPARLPQSAKGLVVSNVDGISCSSHVNCMWQEEGGEVE
jgi:hypothetical protein